MFGNVGKAKPQVRAKTPTGVRTEAKTTTASGRKPNLNVGPRIDTGTRAKSPDLDLNVVRKSSPGPSASKAGNTDASGRSGLVSGFRVPDYVEPKKIQGLVVGRDRKLRDHNKCKIFREVVTNLFETKIEPAKLLYFLENKCREKKDMFAYNYSQDTNLLNLRFCIYLLAEELETIINNLDESHGNNYINSIDAKLEKRNEIINYLLKEKAITQKLFARLLSVFTNAHAECGDLLALAEVLGDAKEKGRFVAKVKAMQNDLTIVDEFKAYAKAYFTEKDINNLVSIQREVPNPLTREQYLKITDFVPVFDRVDRYQQLLDEYKTLASDMTLKEENYSRLLKKYDQLLKDFTDLTVQGTRQIVNPLGPEDYNQIFAKYKEVKEQDRAEKEQAEKERTGSNPKKTSGKKKVTKTSQKKGDRDATPQKMPSPNSKSKSTTKKKKALYDEDTDAISFNESHKQPARAKKVAIDSPERYTGYHPAFNAFQAPADPNLSMESLQPTLNNSFKQHHNPDIDLSKISKHDESPQLKRTNTQGNKQPSKVTFQDDKAAPTDVNASKTDSRPAFGGSSTASDVKKDQWATPTMPGNSSKPNSQAMPPGDPTKVSAGFNNQGSKMEAGRTVEPPKQQTPPQTPSLVVSPPPPAPPAQQGQPASPKPVLPPPTTIGQPTAPAPSPAPGLGMTPPPSPPTAGGHSPTTTSAGGSMPPPPPDLLTLLNQR